MKRAFVVQKWCYICNVIKLRIKSSQIFKLEKSQVQHHCETFSHFALVLSQLFCGGLDIPVKTLRFKSIGPQTHVFIF